MGLGQITMYKAVTLSRTGFNINTSTEGETIEEKVFRMVNNKEPIKDGAPLIYTEKKDGVLAGYNIKTDRWEVALDGIDAIERSKTARREAKAEETRVIELNADGRAESTQGTTNQ